MTINWTEVYGDAVHPPLDWKHPGYRQDTGNIGDMCELAQWHTANCPPWEEVSVQVDEIWNWQKNVWEKVQ